MRLALDRSLSPDQLGALQRLMEQRVIKGTQNSVSLFTKVISGNGVKVTPMAQSFYLSLINQTFGGECAGVSHLLSLATAEGKQQTFMGNIYLAAVDPESPESQAFFQKLAQVHGHVKDRNVAHDPATKRTAAFTTIAPELINSPTSKTLLISSEGHRLSAGVIVGPEGKRTYYYSDPNIGLVEFSSAKAFEQGLKKIFTSPELKYLTNPIVDGSGEPKYIISVFNKNLIPEVSGDSNDVKFMYDAPLSGLDTVKVIDASRLPTSDEFRRQTTPPEKAQVADYDQVSEGLKKLHASKGMPQFHETVAALASVRNFMANHPNAPSMSAMKALEQKLTGAINEAKAPVNYPYAFERMEQESVRQAERKVGLPTDFKSQVMHGTTVDIKSNGKNDPKRSVLVADAVNEVLRKLSQSDPATAEAVGKKLKVIIANPGDQPESQLRLGKPPTLVIGDDFFAPPSASDNTVADRVGSQAQANGGDPTAQKQAALIAGKLGMAGYYKDKPKEFLTAANNSEPFRDVGNKLSQRASRSSRDFVEEAFTARLYDGKLDSQTDASLKRIFSSAGDAPATVAVTPPTIEVARIDEAQVRRLQKLDETRPPIRIGEMDVSRVELYKMGGSLDGKPIEDALASDTEGRKLVGKLQIDYTRFAAYLKSQPGDVGDRVANVLGEIASLRDPASAPLIHRGDGSPIAESLQKNLRELPQHYAAAKALESSKKPLPADFFSPQTPGKGGATKKAGLGFQAFSTFQGLRSSIESFQKGDTTAGVIALGATASDYVGMGVEAGLNKAAQKTISSKAPSMFAFKNSSIGKLIGKAGGVAGAAISVPFDIYNAVDSFKKAANSKGKEAQDHYVNGAIAVASATTSLALTAAFMAGASAAGPAGLAVAVVLMVGQQIYSAVRTVEDINEHVPLTGMQKFDTGLRAFLGFEPGFDVMKPYLEAKYGKAYEEDSRARYKEFLEGPGKPLFERVVFGSTDVEAKMVPGKVSLVSPLWYSPITWPLSLIKVPGEVPAVESKGGNDHIADPYKSWNGKEVKTVEGVQGEGKATFWELGDGDDWATGVKEKPNYFVLGGGKKGVNGGDADDTVVINADARQTLEQAEQVSTSEKDGFSPRQTSLDGGGGRNTLAFSGTLRTSYKEDGEDKHVQYAGHVINFKTNTVSVKTEASNTEGLKKIAHFQSFSNATTVERGESFIQGNDDNNLLTLNGNNDVAFTGKGSNVIIINGGADVTGEGGPNTYMVNQDYRRVTINDPASSVVKLDYSAAQVSGWEASFEGDLTVTLQGESLQEKRTLVIKNAFPKDAKDDDSALPTFITNDGVLMTISAPRKAGIRVPQVSSLKVETEKPEEA
ncbi:hypothetical protein GIR22_01605 [Pseudomonas sp. CCM 7891]|uniref:Uncharacterized protein n=2 Tax=Pseudomonas karstica TaxID=1055468 RepID=A0A7X2RQ45_9PSED|nr:hypothetical protein [Pseudomonas karstica]